MKIYFIGIGGIGVSALARYYLEKGHKVSGSDLASSEITDALIKSGTKIRIGEHKAGNISKDTDLVIYSPAVNPQNHEYKEARKRKIKLQSLKKILSVSSFSIFSSLFGIGELIIDCYLRIGNKYCLF